ncbi:MAG: DUF6036 family nucleotidyltransferase [Clostridiales bacterium]
MQFEKQSEIDKVKLLSIFESINSMLYENLLTVDLYLYGGSYMTLLSDSRPATQDIDCIFNSTNDKIFTIILKTIGKVYGLNGDWFNNEIAKPLSHLSKQDLKEFKKFSNLSIYIPSTEQMLAMKILSSRPEPSKDFIDANILCKELNIKNRKELLTIVSNFIDLKYIGERQNRFIEYLGDDLGYDWR